MNETPGSGPTTVSDGVWHPQRIVVDADGTRAAWVVAKTTAGDTEQAGVWGALIGDVPQRLSDHVPETDLAFDPSGTRLAYAVTVEGNAELVVLDLDNASDRRYPLRGVPETIRWDAVALFVLVAEEGADTASLTSGKPLALDRPWSRSNEDPIGWRRVWRFDEGSGSLRAISPVGLTVWEFATIGGGRIAAVASADPSEDGWYRPILTVLGPGAGDQHDLHLASWQLASPAVDPTATRIAFHEGWSSDRGLGNGDVSVVDVVTGAVTNVGPIGVDVTWLGWSRDGRLWFAGWSGLECAWGWISDVAMSQQRVMVHSERASIMNSPWHPQVVPLPDGRALSVRSTPQSPPEVVLLAGNGEASDWSQLNGAIDRQRGFSLEEVRWTYQGVDVEGLLAVPHSSTGPWPTVVDIHGGPSVAYHHGWDAWWAEPLTAAGFAVFLPNPYGGTGRGQAFGRANLHDPTGAEYEQILAGVRFLGSSGRIDVERVVAMGASYGGYLTAWSLARGELFRGGVVIAGISNLQSCWGTANNPSFYEFLCGGTPKQQPQRYAECSPVNQVSAGSVPALILHGELDQCVPVSQAHELFATLTREGVAAEIVVYPGEGHQVSGFEHICDQRRRVLSFLARVI